MAGIVIFHLFSLENKNLQEVTIPPEKFIDEGKLWKDKEGNLSLSIRTRALNRVPG